MKKQKPSRPTAAKSSQYKTTNWNEYNNALKKRGSLEIWLDEEVLSQWYYQGKMQRGAQFSYSNTCIETANLIKEVYQLGYRQTEGFMNSMVRMLGWVVKVPDYTVIHRRRKTLDIDIVSMKKNSNERLYIVVDSTGGKVYGEGEWKVRQYGWTKHRTWRKIHLAVDESTRIIEGCETTTNNIADEEMVKPLLDGIKGTVKKIAGDGAYDKKKVYETLKKKKIKPIIPPRKNAVIEKHGNCKGRPLPRDKNIRDIRKMGLKKWKKESGYHRRSLAETTMYRLKKRFGGKLISRNLCQQKTEIRLKCKILNTFTLIGMPVAIRYKAA
jgi:hypothetical protein